ncbi:MAG TPA: thiamine pyrophosphate-dependent enzyme [Candidatus Hypogeohydataceae bacterium YC41]
MSEKKGKEMEATWKKYLRKETLPLPFCPGCGHGIVLSAILRAIEASGIDIKDMLFVSGIGCAGWIPSPHIRADTMHVTHGRPIAFATGAKLFNPRLKVMVVSGDGDLASIGGNHLIHAARRDIDMVVVCANNEIYGMTGGQVSPTTGLGVKTTTTLAGNIEPPLDLCKLVEAAGASYVARSTVFHLEHLISLLKRALNLKGFSFIDALSPCPTQYGRRNLYASAAEQLKDLEKRCILLQEASAAPPETLKDKVIIGEFVLRDSKQ